MCYNEFARKVRALAQANHEGTARCPQVGNVVADFSSKKEGAWVDGIYYCPHHPDDNCDCRKPKPKLVLQAAKEYNIDLKHSFVVGDLEMDIGLGKAVGCHTILISPNPGDDDQKQMAPDYTTFDLYHAARWIVSQR